jgi:type IV pilus assembly protein PilE
MQVVQLAQHVMSIPAVLSLSFDQASLSKQVASQRTSYPKHVWPIKQAGKGSTPMHRTLARRCTAPLAAQDGFSLTELMIVLVVVGVLVLLALPRLMPVVTKAKTTEAKLMLKQIHTLEQSYKYENDRYSTVLADIGFEQEKLVTEKGRARYKVEVLSADAKGFKAQATAVVDFDGDGTFDVWMTDESGAIRNSVLD